MSACKRGCCWTPYGHSTAARGCTCHEPVERLVPPRLAEILAELDEEDES